MKGILFFVVMLFSIIAYTQTTVTGVVTAESGAVTQVVILTEWA